MSVYKINQEGVEALNAVASALIETSEGLNNSSSGLLNSVQEYDNSIGPHASSLMNAIEGIQAALKEASEPIECITSKLHGLASEYESIIENNRFTNNAGSSTNGSTSGSSAPGSGSELGNQNGNGSSIDQVSSWIKDINPNYNPFLPPSAHPYNRNCGSCAFAVESRLNGNNSAVASSENIGTDPAMEAATGKTCEYMSVSDIEKKLHDMGPGSHLIVGINRHRTPFGRPQAGHWFNAFYDGNKVYTIDGQCGEIFDWPHDYGDISEWCALV